jgi:Fur family ferric uptake transcriptional regulator
VLDTLRAAPHALSHTELNAQLRRHRQPLDKVTLYRALDWLVSQRLAHAVATDGRSTLYSAREPDAPHAHFHCQRCGHVFCLSQPSAAVALSLPPGFRAAQTDIAVLGACPSCRP